MNYWLILSDVEELIEELTIHFRGMTFNDAGSHSIFKESPHWTEFIDFCKKKGKLYVARHVGINVSSVGKDHTKYFVTEFYPNIKKHF